MSEWKEQGTVIKRALLTGVSYMLPFVVAGGILIAIGFALGGIYVADGSGFAADVYTWGKAAMGLMTAVLGGYIAYSMADKPALAPGFLAGAIASTQGSGFLGAILGGVVAGYVVLALKKIRLPFALRSLLPVLIIPVLGSLVMGVLMTYVVGIPVTWLNTWMLDTLQSMSGGTLILLGVIQGAMLAFDMGGPVNKAAYAFALAAADAGNWAPMAANFVASMAPPLGIGLAILIARRKFTRSEQASIGGLFVGAAGMITEFAIPFAAANPLRVIPALMAGSSVGAALSYVAGLTMQAPHGGLFVILLCNKPLLFLLILGVSGLITAVTLIALRPTLPAEEAADEAAPATADENALQLD
ncbi:MAG TPA: PTS fructose transporter subunit IIC [Cellulomonas sp.]